ncbi:right-handed parallel beta-helix repeat-containing protein, partial [Thermodesulfobacteriota bacterium]
MKPKKSAQNSAAVYNAQKVTELSGVISKNTTLMGIVKVVKDVYVPEGVALRFLKGTEVRFEKSESTKVEPFYLKSNTEILVRGTIIAKGTKENKVRFVSELDSEGNKEFSGIILMKSDEALFEHAQFENAETAIQATKSNLTIKHSEFSNCFYALSTSESLVSIDTVTVRDSDKGLYFHKNSAGKVKNSAFSNCKEDAIFIDKRSDIKIT